MKTENARQQEEFMHCIDGCCSGNNVTDKNFFGDFQKPYTGR